MVPVPLITDGDRSCGAAAGLDILGWEPMAWVCAGMPAGEGRCARNCWPTVETIVDSLDLRFRLSP